MEILNLIAPQNGLQTRVLPREQQKELNLDWTSGPSCVSYVQAQLFCFSEPKGFRKQLYKP